MDIGDSCKRFNFTGHHPRYRIHGGISPSIQLSKVDGLAIVKKVDMISPGCDIPGAFKISPISSLRWT